MKISARTCSAPETVTNPEPDLEFYLEDASTSVILKVRDKASGRSIASYILSIHKSTGRIARCLAVNSEFGLPLNGSGQLKLTCEA